MHLLFDQISNLLAGASYNYLQNSELSTDLPDAALFSKLFSQYASETGDANLASFPGNLHPAAGLQTAQQPAFQNRSLPHVEIDIDIDITVPVNNSVTSQTSAVQNSVLPERVVQESPVRPPATSHPVAINETIRGEARQAQPINYSKEIDIEVNLPVQNSNVNNRATKDSAIPPTAQTNLSSDRNVVKNVSPDTQATRETTAQIFREPLPASNVTTSKTTQQNPAKTTLDIENISTPVELKPNLSRNENSVTNHTVSNTVRPTSEPITERIIIGANESAGRESVVAKPSQASPTSENLNTKQSFPINAGAVVVERGLPLNKQNRICSNEY